MVVDGEPATAGVGRPARPVRLNPDGPVALGVEINVDYVAACVLDLTGALRCYQLRAVDNRDSDPAEVLDQAIAVARAVRAEQGQPLLGAGLALPGVVGADGALLRAPNLPALTGRLPGRQLAAALGLPAMLVDNEANLGALASLRAEPGVGPDFVYVSGEIGVGAGLVVAGELFRGVSGYAGELGHVVVDRDGPDCGCGGRGCVERYAGQDVLLRTAGQPDLPGLEAAVAAGDRAALAAVAAGRQRPRGGAGLAAQRAGPAERGARRRVRPAVRRDHPGPGRAAGPPRGGAPRHRPAASLGTGHRRGGAGCGGGGAGAGAARPGRYRGARRVWRSQGVRLTVRRAGRQDAADRLAKPRVRLSGSGGSSGSSSPWRTPRTG